MEDRTTTGFLDGETHGNVRCRGSQWLLVSAAVIEGTKIYEVMYQYQLRRALFPARTRERSTKSFHLSKHVALRCSRRRPAHTAPLHRSIPVFCNRIFLRPSTRKMLALWRLLRPRSTTGCSTSSAHAVKILWRTLRRRMSRRRKSLGRSNRRGGGIALHRCR